MTDQRTCAHFKWEARITYYRSVVKHALVVSTATGGDLRNIQRAPAGYRPNESWEESATTSARGPVGNDSNTAIARHERVFEAKVGSSTVTLD
jgi:hypothetical protein